MIFDSIIGHATCDEADIDWVDITYAQTVRRALRLVSRSGRKVDVLLPRGISMHHGDVLGAVDNQRIAICVTPIALIRLQPQTIEQSLRVSIELGNLHLPSEVQCNSLLTLDDGPAIELAYRLGISFTQLIAPFHPLRCTMIYDLENEF